MWQPGSHSLLMFWMMESMCESCFGDERQRLASVATPPFMPRMSPNPGFYTCIIPS